MTKAEKLLANAARCTDLAESCSDPAIAGKLRQLARDYLELAGRPAADDKACAKSAVTGAAQSPAEPA